MSRNWTGAPGPEPLGIRAGLRWQRSRYRVVKGDDLAIEDFRIPGWWYAGNESDGTEVMMTFGTIAFRRTFPGASREMRDSIVDFCIDWRYVTKAGHVSVDERGTIVIENWHVCGPPP